MHQSKLMHTGITMTDNIALSTLAVEQSLELHFREVCYSLNNQVHKGPKYILNDVCGSFKAGRLTAILGPSGAGKSTLLNVLAGFKVKGVSGQFLLNGQPRDLMSFRQMSSYIEQNFAMLSLLTVEETLRVSADLKLPSSTSQQEKQNILDAIIEVLNLHSCRHILVRDTSGGEHKRLSIGIELITNPPIMFFDEPTSGLDSVASFQVMSYLQQLAQNGRIVVCVVHQPSSRLMQLFDDVLVLAHGEVLYSGPQSEMLSSFESAGFSCPKYYNPGDFVLEVGSGSSNQRCDSLIIQNKIMHNSLKSSLNGSVDEQSALVGQTNQICNNESYIRPKEQVGFWLQLRVLMGRHFRSTYRNMIAVKMRFIVHILVALLLGIVYWQIGNDASKVISNVACQFFIILFIYAGNAMPSILLCIQDSPVFIREYYNGWYSLGAYYISKVLADLPMQIICPTLFIGISYFMTGQPLELSRFVMCWTILVLTAVIAHFIGVIGGTLMSMQMAIFIVPAVTIPFLLFSGFFIRFSELSWFLRPICDISFFRYIFQALMRGIYGYERDNLPCHTEFCYHKSPEKLLKDFDMAGNYFGSDISILMLFLLLLLVTFNVSLHVRIRRAL